MRFLLTSNMQPKICIVISGDRLVIAMSPKAFVGLVIEKALEKPKANGKTKALDIGPDATLPESKAILEKSDGVTIVKIKMSKYDGMIKYQMLNSKNIRNTARATKKEVPNAKAINITGALMFPSEISSTSFIKA